MHAVSEARALDSTKRRSFAVTATAPALVGTALVVASFVVYLLCNRQFNAGRGDFFYLADAFLHGRTWLAHALGPNDDVLIGTKVYVPFGPFPAFLLLPLVAVFGPARADTWQPIVNAALAALDVGLVWVLVSRIGVRSLFDRVVLAVLFGFSTQILWVTTRGGVWHTGHLVASALTLIVLMELFGRRRMLAIGVLSGAAFLTRAPLLFALPFYGLWALLERTPPGRFDARFGPLRARTADAATTAGAAALTARIRGLPIRDWLLLTAGTAPAIALYLWYNAERFGSPLESGYELATLPPFLEVLRRQGLFALVHVPMNLDYLFWHLPKLIPNFPFFRPDGLGMSIFLTSPALLLALRAPWRDRRTWLLAAAFVFTLIPSLLYYGGGWLQFGYRYALDAIPFAIALAAMSAASRGGIGLGWKLLVVFGVLVNAAGVYWAYNL